MHLQMPIPVLICALVTGPPVCFVQCPDKDQHSLSYLHPFREQMHGQMPIPTATRRLLRISTCIGQEMAYEDNFQCPRRSLPEPYRAS